MKPQIHFGFRSTEEAYDESQTNKNIHDGDILVVDFQRTFERRHSVAILIEAWPTLVSGERGQFHVLLDNNMLGWAGIDKGQYLESYEIARRILWTGE